jgi:hypothetical protein
MLEGVDVFNGVKFSTVVESLENKDIFAKVGS